MSVQIETKDRVAHVVIDNPPVNAVSRAVRQGLLDAATRIPVMQGMAMGVFEVQNLAGLDIGAYQRKTARERGEMPFAPVADRLAAAGPLGRKTGGWYDYAAGRAEPDSPPQVAEAIPAARAENGAETRDWSDDAIVEVMILPMIDEATRIVDEGIALRASDIDLVEVHGYGFPRFRGGLVRYGRSRRLPEVVARLEALPGEGLAPAVSPRLRSWAVETTAVNPRQNSRRKSR